MLPRLKPACFYDLVVEVAIVRPGPIQGGMVHPYLKRRQGLEPVTYPSTRVKSVLERTLGVPIFQEQVMQLAIVAAGFTPGEADQLRRSMAAWRRKGGLEKFEQRLIDGMAQRGLSETFARQIYQQILGFGEYGFPESHSASFSLLVYVSSWIKRYEPAAFCAALLNSQPMGFYAPAQLVADARRHGVEVRSADVTISEWDLHAGRPRPRPGNAPRLAHGRRARRRTASRASWPSAPSDRSRTSPTSRIAQGSIAAISPRSRARRARIAGRPSPQRRVGSRGRGEAAADLAVRGTTFDDADPQLPVPTEGQDIVADYRALGLTLGRHPLALLRRQLAQAKAPHRRRHRARAAWPHRTHGRHRHRPAASRTPRAASSS
jgi:error-prone DNA polymerase